MIVKKEIPSLNLFPTKILGTIFCKSGVQSILFFDTQSSTIFLYKVTAFFLDNKIKLNRLNIFLKC